MVNKLLQLEVKGLEQSKFLLRAEKFNAKDKDIQFYTGFHTWDLFMLFFQSLSVYDLDNLQYYGRARTFPDGNKRGLARALNLLNEYFLTLIRLRLGLYE